MKTLFLILFTFSNIILTAQNWETDLDTAKSLAQKNQQPVVLVFQGSDWCAPCIKLDRKIWQSETFKTYAKEHFVMLKADFPRRKKNRLSEAQQNKNNRLAELYNPHGKFPMVVVLDAQGKVLGRIGFKRRWSPQDYINWINGLSENK